MADILNFNSSNAFKGVIWNTMADGNNNRLFLEVRDVQEKKVSFSALNLQNNEWLWKDISFEEPWWISLGAIAGDVLLLVIYTDQTNPDKKSLLAYDVLRNEITWWYNGFSLSGANALYVKGVDSKFPAKEILLDVSTGKPLPGAGVVDFALSQNFPVIKPFQYQEGTGHFDTVAEFLRTRCDIVPAAVIEYLEHKSLILVSVFVKERDLANYLYVFTDSGQVLLKEKLGDYLKGVGLDTFFVFSDYLIFVKNKHELISYRIV